MVAGKGKTRPQGVGARQLSAALQSPEPETWLAVDRDKRLAENFTQH